MMKSKKAYSMMLLVFLSFLVRSQSQKLQIGSLIGHCQFYGDIESTDQINLGSNRTAYGAYLSYEFMNGMHVKTEYQKQKLFAQDDLTKTKRNLHFRANIDEISLNVQFLPLQWINKTKRSKIQPFITAGLACMLFDPQAQYNGNWIRLHPLSTEGQGLPGSNVPEYELLTFSKLLGLGIKTTIGKNIVLQLSAVSRYTNTDYLDDVSGNYYDLREIKKYKGLIASSLAYRKEGVIPEDEWMYQNMPRGNTMPKDSYLVTSFSIGYRF
jgi:hypothetical protein